jgi:sugar transferase (PEP-CTERM system associated)
MRIRFLGHHVHVAIVWLAVAEFATAYATLGFIGWLLGAGDVPARAMIERHWQAGAAFAFAYSVGSVALGIYTTGQRVRLPGLLLRTALALVVAWGVTLFIARTFGWTELTQLPIARAAAITFALSIVLRLSFLRALDEDALKRRVLVFGGGRLASSLLGLRRRADRRGFYIVGYAPVPGERITVPGDKIMYSELPLLELCRKYEADEIVVAMDDRRRNFPVAELLDARMAGIDVTEIVGFLERETGKVRLDVLNPTWLIFGEGYRRDIARLATGRLLDLLASTSVLLLTWPVMLIAAIAIKIEDGPSAPIFYRQTRVGLLGRHFELVKFRSMGIDAEERGAQWAQEGDPRVTRVGAFMRKTRIDELPQILCVLAGDMSFVGPRPERPEFVEQLSERVPYYRERHWVKPGITGWAQLRYPYGSSEADAAEKLQYDLYYVKNHSLLFDLMILLQTAEVVMFGKGAR